jgi:hypothetical protein
LQVEWEWRAYNWPQFTSLHPEGYKRKDFVIAGPVPRDSFTLELTAKFTDASVATQYNVTLVPEASPVRAVLTGPSGDVRTDRSIILNATSSVDPDDPTNNKEPFQIDWQCVRDDFPAPCFSGKDYGTQRGLTWNISGSLLSAERTYTFTATVKKSDGRSDKASLVIKASAAAIPTARIVRVCGGACPEKHSADKDLSLSVVADAGLADATIAWTSTQVDGISGFDGESSLLMIKERVYINL